MPSVICFLFMRTYDACEEEGLMMSFVSKDDIPKSVLKALTDMLVVDEDACQDDAELRGFVDLLKNAPRCTKIPTNASCADVLRIQLRESGDDSDTLCSSDDMLLHRRWEEHRGRRRV